MIDHSVPWREDLARSAARLRARLNQQRWQQRTFYLVEKDLMNGFFAIRRLIDSRKTSSRLRSKHVPVRVCPLTGKEPSVLDRWSPWDNFDLLSKQRSELDVGSLLNEFIDSFILMLSFSDGGNFLGVFVGSDRTKSRRLYEVSIGDIIDLFEYVAHEEVVIGSWRSDERAVQLSQHDLVEVGAARYPDATRTWFEIERSFPTDGFDRLSDLSADQLKYVKGAWAYLLRPSGQALPGYALVETITVNAPSTGPPGAYGFTPEG